MHTSQRSDEEGSQFDRGDQPGAKPLRLRPPRNGVDRRAIRWWAAQALAVAVPLVIVLALLMPWFPLARLWLIFAAGAVVILGAVYVVVVPGWRYRVHRWEITEAAVYSASGWLWQEWRVAPISRIQTIDTERGPLQRTFGLATITITTASAAGAIQISGLDHRVAAELVERLAQKTQATPGDAT